MFSNIAARSSGVLPLLGLLGCATAQIDREANAERAYVRARGDAAVVFPSCQGGGIADRCGLVLHFTATESFRQRFRERVCAERDEAGCQTALNRYVDANLARRYVFADWDAAARQCDLTPPTCDEPVAYEMMLLTSHNRAVRAAQFESEERIERDRAARHSEHAADVFRTVVGVAQLAAHAAHDGPKCRSYPSILTGETLTTCSR